MVRSINEIGHLTGKLTIAEFAENAEIISVLRSLGVDYAQGYGIASPQRITKVAAVGG
jgi:EAL domain-containing protein (putative c-di-GMP-specific phosphodiesterase class I)